MRLEHLLSGAERRSLPPTDDCEIDSVSEAQLTRRGFLENFKEGKDIRTENDTRSYYNYKLHSLYPRFPPSLRWRESKESFSTGRDLQSPLAQLVRALH